MKKERQKRFVRWRLAIFLLMLLAIVLLAGLVWSARVTLVRPLALGTDGLLFDVEAGSNLSRVLNQLEQDRLLKWPFWVRFYAWLENKSDIHAGEYFLPEGSTAVELVDRLNRGEVTRYRLTLIEGWTFKQALEKVRSGRKIVKTESGRNTEAVATALGLDSNLEGRIFPDTYIYRSGTTDIDLLRQAYQRMEQVLAEEWQNRSSNLPYKSPYDALIMASLIEKETGSTDERDKIAGVFVRRLQKGMRLQTDPTVIYGLGSSYQGDLKLVHLSQATPYNTYVIYGLPPTPIALPGREAIRAALHPKASDALYFVAKGDGSHYFSATLPEHNKAVRKYQLKPSANYRSRPVLRRRETANEEANP